MHIIENTVEICTLGGIPNPKVAPLATVEVVNPKMPVTVEAQELTQMCEEGKITGCIVDGPPLDLAIDPEAQNTKEQKAEKSLVMQMFFFSLISMQVTLYTNVLYTQQK